MPDARPEVLDFLLNRRSRPAKTLGAHAPDRAALETMLTAAARTPDHGKLAPWRFVVLSDGDIRQGIADIARSRMAEIGLDEAKIDKNANAFGQGGVIVAVISSTKPSEKIPAWEQELSAGAVCLALLNAALASGWGANWLTGPLARDAQFLSAALDCAAEEFVAGFIHIGDEQVTPTDRDRPDLAEIVEWR